jgi:hypothetical protein
MTIIEFSDWVNNSGLAFNGGVNIVSMSTGQAVPVNKVYCATAECAEKLATFLQAQMPAVVMKDPYFLVPGSPFKFTDKASFLQFANGLCENVGLLVSVFTHGYDPSRMMRYILWSIASDSYTFGYSGDIPGPFVP